MQGSQMNLPPVIAQFLAYQRRAVPEVEGAPQAEPTEATLAAQRADLVAYIRALREGRSDQ